MKAAALPPNPKSITPRNGANSTAFLLSPPPTSSSSAAEYYEQSDWDVAQIRADLHVSSQLLSDRNLKLAAKFAMQQWMGLPAQVVEEATISSASRLIPEELLSASAQERYPAVLYAKTLMELGEYAHAAATLSQPSLSKTTESMPPPLEDLSAVGIYVRAYALYMAGERRKEEDSMEQQSDTQKHVPSFNPYLLQLSHELLEAYQSDKLDAFGLYAYGMVLLAAKSLPPIRNAPTTQSILMKSILLFPYNWSAWLDLATCALDDASIEQEIEQSLQPILGGHFMYYFFCAHMQAERQAHAEALAIYERMLDPALFGASPYLMTQYALMQYHLRNISEAKRMLEDLHHHTPYRLDSMDVYSNILYVQNDSVGLSQLAHTAVKVDKYRPETCVIVGNYYSIKQQRAKAIQYFQRALKVDSNFTSAWTLMGHEYVEWKRTANAMEAYRRALHAAPNDYRAYYGLGQTYEILNMYMFALYYYKRATQLRPYDARMWCSLGVTFMQLGRPLDAIQAYERAMEQEDTEGVATQKLAALYKQSGQVEKAARCYLRYLELRYQATNTHGVTADDVSLDIMLHGLVVDGAEAEALLYLAHYHKEHGEYETSMIFCSRLLEYPGPEKDQAKGLLRELRQRSVTQARPAMRTRSKGPPASSSGFAFSP